MKLVIRRLLLTSVALSFSTAAFANDAPGVLESNNPFVYFQILGGVTAAGTITQINPATNVYDLSAGRAIVGTVGVVVYDGLSIEADVLHTLRAYPDFPGDTFSTTSLMANVKYTAALNDTFSVYGAVGAGAIWGVDYFEVWDAYFDVAGFGYQLIAGASASLTENLAAVAEIRYQNAFGRLQDGPGTDIRETPVVAITAGLKVGF